MDCRRQKIGCLTLLEVLFAGILTAILLGVLWNVYYSWTKSQMQMRKEQQELHKNLFVRQRLEILSDRICACAASISLQPGIHGVCFFYEGGVDPDPSFAQDVTSLLYVDEHNRLSLVTWNKDGQSRLEILWEGVRSCSYSFFNHRTALWEDKWEREEVPLWVKLRINGSEEIQVRCAVFDTPISCKRDT